MKTLKEDFLLSKEYTHLNHGSFGACPKPIFENYQQWQLALERNPVDFYIHRGMEQLEISKQHLARYLHCNADDLVFTTNPTYAINIIAKSLALQKGDEILATDHEYGALDRTWRYYCGKIGANYIQQPIPIPLRSKEEIFDAFWKGYSPKTKAIFVSQITSSTAQIFPIKEICEHAKKCGLLTIIDGAHVPGHIPLNLSTLNADIYTGACHKWMLTPKGCSFLYVRKEIQDDFDPVIISWGYDADPPGKSKFLDYHQVQGTRDYSAFLTIPAAIEYMHQNDWERVSSEAKQLILNNYESLCSIVHSSPIVPLNQEHLGQMCSIPLYIKNPTEFKRILFHDYRIEIPIFQLREHVFMRLSAQAYVSQQDVNYLKSVLIELREKGLFRKTNGT